MSGFFILIVFQRKIILIYFKLFYLFWVFSKEEDKKQTLNIINYIICIIIVNCKQGRD